MLNIGKYKNKYLIATYINAKNEYYIVLLRLHDLIGNSPLNNGIKYMGLPNGESLNWDDKINLFNFLFQMNNMNDNKSYLIFFKSSEIIKKWRL
jgi:hypothetical protein